MKEKILNWIAENIDSYIEVDEESARMGFPYHYINTSSLKYDLGKFIDSIECE
jgi:hypothetical protein